MGDCPRMYSREGKNIYRVFVREKIFRGLIFHGETYGAECPENCSRRCCRITSLYVQRLRFEQPWLTHRHTVRCFDPLCHKLSQFR